MSDIRQYHLSPTRLIPNSPRPLLHYKNVFPRNSDGSNCCDQTTVWQRFESNGWDVQWIFRYGPTQLSHFHSSAHEVMAVLSGTATIRFGVGDTSENLDTNSWGLAWEDGGVELKAEAGDVFLIPAGVAHKTYNTRPASDFALLTPGNGHGIESQNPREALEAVQLSGFTMLGAYNGGKWDFVKSGGDYEQIWSLPRPERDPVFGEVAEGINRFWFRGS